MESVGVRIGPVTVLTTTVTLECVYNKHPESLRGILRDEDGVAREQTSRQ